MAGLYVPLDVEFFHDPKMIDAGPMAELLYVRGLAFAKRAMKDGAIARSQLAAIALNIPKPQAIAARLVAVGAWEETPQGWQIAGWLKRNKSVAQITAEAEAKRRKALHGNHKRWHVEKGEFDPGCEFCSSSDDSPDDSPNESPSDRSEGKRSEEKGSERESESEVRGKNLNDLHQEHSHVTRGHRRGNSETEPRRFGT